MNNLGEVGGGGCGGGVLEGTNGNLCFLFF